MEKILETRPGFHQNQVNSYLRVEVWEDVKSSGSERVQRNAIIGEFRHLSNQCSQKQTNQPSISANSDTGRQATVKNMVQPADPKQESNINRVQAEAVFGHTVYVKVELDRQKHKALMDTGSNVNILSEKTYSQCEKRSKL